MEILRSRKICRVCVWLFIYMKGITVRKKPIFCIASLVRRLCHFEPISPSTQIWGRFKKSICNLTKEKWSKLDVSLFFGEFFKLPMSQKRPSYESPRFARSSNKWFRYNFFRDKKQQDNQSKHYNSRNKWLKIQVFPIKIKGTTKRCFLPPCVIGDAGVHIGCTVECNSLHRWMTMKGIMEIDLYAKRKKTGLVSYMLETYPKGALQ